MVQQKHLAFGLSFEQPGLYLLFTSAGLVLDMFFHSSWIKVGTFHRLLLEFLM